MKKRHKVWIIIGSVLVVVVAVGVILISSLQTSMKQLAAEDIPNVDLSEIPDGVYDGSFSSFPISVKVEVTIDDHTISNIDLIEHVNGKGDAAEAIPDMVVDAQSLQVDAVSGATCSSKAILKAIKDALTTP